MLSRHLKKFTYNQETGGEWVDSVYIEGTITNISFDAAPFPIDQKTLSLLPEGAIQPDSIRIYTKYDLGEILETDIIRVDNNKKYRVYQGKPFQEIADLKIYLLNRIEGES